MPFDAVEISVDRCRILAIAPPLVQPASPQKQARSAVYIIRLC
ncbi:MAG TPA: hypothetical protein V6C84_15910 [Coleofasciculaceae cyanobacterium]